MLTSSFCRASLCAMWYLPSSTHVPIRTLKSSSQSASVDRSVVNYGHQQPGPPLSSEQQLSLVDVLFQSTDQTLRTVSLLILDLLTHTLPSDVP